MTQLCLKDLSRGDVAIIECQVHRYQVPLPDKKTTTAPWINWWAAFQLSGITRLWAATSSAPTEIESDAENIERENTDDEYEGF